MFITCYRLGSDNNVNPRYRGLNKIEVYFCYEQVWARNRELMCGLTLFLCHPVCILHFKVQYDRSHLCYQFHAEVNWEGEIPFKGTTWKL